MIPVTSNNYEVINLDVLPENINELKWYKLLKTQLLWLNKNKKDVKGKANKLYEMYKLNKLPERIRIRCCNFTLLEEKCVEFNKL